MDFRNISTKQLSNKKLINSEIYLNYVNFFNDGNAEGVLILYSTEGQLTSAHLGTGDAQNGIKYTYITLPNDFDSWQNEGCVVKTIVSNINKSYTLTIYNNGIKDSVIDTVSIIPTLSNEMQEFIFSFGSEYKKGDRLFIKIEADEIDTDETFEILDMQLNYRKAVI